MFAPLALAFASSFLSQDFEALANINTAELASTSYPASGNEIKDRPSAAFQGFQGDVYFLAKNLSTGFSQHLFRATHTPTAPLVILDMGSVGSQVFPSGPDGPGGFVELGSDLFMRAAVGGGFELSRVNPAADAVEQVADIFPGPASADVSFLFRFKHKLYFAATDGVLGKELWSSDGSAAGTQMIFDCLPGSGSSDPQNFSVDPSGARFYFQASGPEGVELWSSDGTSAGTSLLVDINGGVNDSNPRRFATVGGRTIFVADDVDGAELWTTDGSAGGTHQVKDIFNLFGGSDPRLDLGVEINGQYYFSANDGLVGHELWSTNGLASGTALVGDLVPGAASSRPGQIVELNGQLFFMADVAGNGRGLYSVGGSPVSASLVADLGSKSSDDAEILVSDDSIYFVVETDEAGSELWVSDGTGPGTRLVTDLEEGPEGSQPGNLTAFPGGGVLFSASTYFIGRELFLSFGVSANTVLFADMAPGFTSADSQPRGLSVVSGRTLYFTANNGIYGHEPYRWDPVNGAQALGNLNPEPGKQSSNARDYTRVWLGDHEAVFFAAQNPTNGDELWVTDGTKSGTHMVKDIYPGSTGSEPTELTSAGGRLFFSAISPGVGQELWVSDGTAAGTHLVADLDPSDQYAGPSGMQAFGQGVVFIQVNSANLNWRLWVSDGSQAGSLVIDEALFYPLLGVKDDRVVFVRDTGVFFSPIMTLVTSDGTVQGTKKQHGLPQNSGLGNLYLDFAWAGNKLLIEGSVNGAGYVLTSSDMTAPAAEVVASSPFGSTAGGHYKHLTSAGDQVFFLGHGQSPGGVFLGEVVYVSDGTAGGTQLASSLAPAASSLSPGAYYGDDSALTASGKGVYFSRNTAGAGAGAKQQIWFTDGSDMGTFMAVELPSGTEGDAESLRVVDGRLVFVANVNAQGGEELFATGQVTADVQDVGISGSGMRIKSSPPFIGSTFKVEGTNSPVGAVSFLGISALRSAPGSEFMGAGSASWLDLPTAYVRHVTATADWELTLTVPNSPALAGVRLAMQSWTLGSPAFPASSSNGLLLLVGL